MNPKLTILPLLLAALAVYSAFQATQTHTQSHPIDSIFENWMLLHNKAYSSAEKNYRLVIFTENYYSIEKHNAEFARGIHSYTQIANKFADLTDQEFAAIHLTPMRKSKQTKTITSYCQGYFQDVPNPPETVDWSKRATTEVMDEGSCGSSWAFATTGAVEGTYALTKGRIIKFSDQQLLDCSSIYGNEGCMGGFMDQGLWYIIDEGITTAELYPYAQKASKCLYKPTMKAATLKNCAEVDSGNYTKLMQAVVQGPVAVAVDATSFRFYNDGVYSGNCGTDLNRGMLVVGYGAQDGKNFWNLKNSLGSNWGRSGYMLLLRDKLDGTGKCGVQIAPFAAMDAGSN